MNPLPDSPKQGQYQSLLTVALAAAYALILALAFGTQDAVALLVTEGLFAGPIIVAAILSAFIARATSRSILLGYAVAFAALSALIFFVTFGFEHDAQYQLKLLLIPLIGYPFLIIAALSAANVR